MIDAQWTAERRGLARFRSEQQPYSILNRGIEREVLPVCNRFGMAVSSWSPLTKGLLTGKYRKDQATPDSLRAKYFPTLMSDARSLDAVEQLHALAESAGMSLTHMSLAFVIAHPAMTSAIIGPRTMAQLDDLLAAVDVRLSDDVLDAINAIVPPGADIAPLEGSAYVPPGIQRVELRRRAEADFDPPVPNTAILPTHS